MTKDILNIMHLSYVQAALWSTGHDDLEALDELYIHADLSTQADKAAYKACEVFYNKCKDILTENDPSQWGHDFWLTRCGHGAGFWDGDYPIHGDELTKACESFGDVYLFVGDDNKIYSE